MSVTLQIVLKATYLMNTEAEKKMDQWQKRRAGTKNSIESFSTIFRIIKDFHRSMCIYIKQT